MAMQSAFSSTSYCALHAPLRAGLVYPCVAPFGEDEDMTIPEGAIGEDEGIGEEEFIGE